MLSIEDAIWSCIQCFGNDPTKMPAHYIAHVPERDILLELKANDFSLDKDKKPYQVSFLRRGELDLPVKIEDSMVGTDTYIRGNARMLIIPTESTGWFSRHGLGEKDRESCLSVRGDLGGNFTGEFRFSSPGLREHQIAAFFRFLGLPDTDYQVVDSLE